MELTSENIESVLFDDGTLATDILCIETTKMYAGDDVYAHGLTVEWLDADGRFRSKSSKIGEARFKRRKADS